MEDCLIVNDDTHVSYQMIDSKICDLLTSDMSNGSNDDHQNEVGEKISNEQLIFSNLRAGLWNAAKKLFP